MTCGEHLDSHWLKSELRRTEELRFPLWLSQHFFLLTDGIDQLKFLFVPSNTACPSLTQLLRWNYICTAALITGPLSFLQEINNRMCVSVFHFLPVVWDFFLRTGPIQMHQQSKRVLQEWHWQRGTMKFKGNWLTRIYQSGDIFLEAPLTRSHCIKESSSDECSAQLHQKKTAQPCEYDTW